MKTKTYEIVCTILVSDDYQFDPDKVARRVRDEIAGAIEDNRDAERDFEYIGTEINITPEGQ